MISKSSEEVGDAAIEEKYLIATSEQPLCAMHRYGISQLHVHAPEAAHFS